MNVVELPKFVLENLSLGIRSKASNQRQFNVVHILGYVDRLVCELSENNNDGEKLNEIELSAEWYAKNVRETSMDRAVEKVNDFLKGQELLAVPFGKGSGNL